MKEDFPKIDDLVSGINDPDVSYLDGLRKAAQNDDIVKEKPVKPISKGNAEVKTEAKAKEKAQVDTKDKSEAQTQEKSVNRMEKKTEDMPTQEKEKVETPVPQSKTKVSDRKQKAFAQVHDQCWLGFIDYLQHIDEEEEKLIKNGCPVVRLERVLAATLDECNIFNRNRSEIVNAIVQSFLDTYMGNILPYHTIVKTKTLFENYNPTKQ